MVVSPDHESRGLVVFRSSQVSDYAQDVAKINPIHVIVAGGDCRHRFVVGLVPLIQWVVSSGVARRSSV